MDRFGQQQLMAAFVGVVALIAGGFLFLLFKSPASVPSEMRVTDYAAEMAAGTLQKTSAATAPEPAEKVDLEGEFETFDGKPGHSEANWPNFRGADYSNIVNSAVPLADAWPESGPPQLWEVDLGEGYAGAVVWKGCVYVIDYDPAKEGDALRSFSIDDGKEIWRRFYHAPTKANHGMTRTVPAVNDDYIVSIGPRCHTLCVSRETGDFRWGIDMVADYGTEVPLWYTGQCPLLDGNTVVLAPGGKAFMIGVDCETGEVLWETPNPNGWKMSHSSIIPMTLLGKKTYVYMSVGGVVGVSAEEADRGTLLWETNEWTHSVISPSPIQIDDSRVFLTAGYGAGSMMIQLKEEGGKIVPQPVYQLDKTAFACEQQTPTFYQGHLFSILPKDAAALRGQFVCLDTDGKFVWASGKTNRFGLGPFLLANDRFYLLDDHGELTMCRASLKDYEIMAKAQVLHGHDAWGPMALVDGKLILRDSLKMICLDVSAP
ncbi:MAG: PQQ-binding-like beta-propeller repeat protein [Verrucomicrobiae bacterium]|nr:PQQ-binding-like beta-propeller repeat protein [Verrucomicrobiae bacterium]